jgi:hypothetical protein
MGDRLIMPRKRIKHVKSLEERLLGFAKDARNAAHKLPPGEDQQRLLQSAVDGEAAVEINRWLASPGLRPPR